MKIDLADKTSNGPLMAEKQSGPYYPTVYIRNKEITDAKMDQEVTITGRVKGIHKDERDGEVTIGIDVECVEAEFGGTSKKSPKKDKSISRLSSMADDESEIDKGIKAAEDKSAKKDEE